MKKVLYLSGVAAIILITSWASIAEAYVDISLTPSAATVAPGDIFTIDVALSNPSLDGIYGIGIWLKYDAASFSVLDYDAGNWITAGTNILDGIYHGVFNFPGESYAPNANDANTDGQIWWSVSESDAQWPGQQTPAGIFATIKLQAEATSGTTNLWFDGAGTGGAPDTFVLSKITGENILSGANGASITIADTLNVVPEPSSILLLGTGLFGIFSFIRKKDRR